jgi:hypothetical protein
MPAQERELRKNFIAILNDKAEERRAVASLAKSDRPVKDCVRVLTAVILNRFGDAR